jgi:ligand-binding sensor domain-containing protein
MKKLILLIFIIFFAGEAVSQQWIVYKKNNSGLPDNNILKITVDSNNIIWIGTSMGGLVRFDRSTWTVWDTTNSPLKCNGRINNLIVDRYNNKWLSNFMDGYNSAGIFKFDGVNWVNYNVNNSGLCYNVVLSFDFENNGAMWIATPKCLSKFINNNWEHFDTLNSNIHSQNIFNVAVEGHIKWLSTYGRGISKFNDTTFVMYDMSNSGLSSNYIRTIVIDRFGNKWFGTYQGGLDKFNSQTNQWTVYYDDGIPSPFIDCVLIDKKDRVWVGTANQYLGVLTDTGWVVFNETNSPIPGDYVKTLALDRYGNLWIGTIDGIAVYNETGIIGINESNGNYVPTDFYLYQNYPNPFNSSSIIKYSINKKSYITLNVFDVLGRKLQELDKGIKNIGEYQIRFDGTGLPSGIYFYRLSSDNTIETKKLLLVK